MKVTTKGQVTIPARIRGFLGITPHTDVDFEIAGGRVVLVKSKPGQAPRTRFTAMRGILKGPRTTHEWMKATRGD